MNIYNYEKLTTITVIVCSIVVVSLSIYMGIFMPTHLYHQSKCIKAGYPKSVVTYDLKAYCINSDGGVTPIEELK